MRATRAAHAAHLALRAQHGLQPRGLTGDLHREGHPRRAAGCDWRRVQAAPRELGWTSDAALRETPRCLRMAWACWSAAAHRRASASSTSRRPRSFDHYVDALLQRLE